MTLTGGAHSSAGKRARVHCWFGPCGMGHREKEGGIERGARPREGGTWPAQREGVALFFQIKTDFLFLS